jgi:hypothetical protein
LAIHRRSSPWRQLLHSSRRSLSLCPPLPPGSVVGYFN